MAIQQLDLSGPIRLAGTLKEQQQSADESAQRMTEGKLNIQKLQLALQQAQKDQAENDQIKSRIAQGGDPEAVYQDLLKVNPDKARAYLTNSQSDVLQNQQQALLRAKTLEGQVAPEVQTAAPQTSTAPIQTSLTDPSQVSTPQVSAPATQQVPLPLPKVSVPFIGQPSTAIQPQSQQQLTLAAQAKARFDAALEASKKAAEGVVIPEGGVLHRDGQPDVIGQPKQSDIEKEAAPWLAKNPGKTLDDYVAFKQSSAQPHDPFQETYLPAYLRSHGITATSPQAQKDAVTLKANEDYKKIAQDPAMQEILRSNASNSQLEKSYSSNDNQLKELRKPVDSISANVSSARDLLNQDNPSANALAAPAIIKAVVGGAGSGVRITTPEINAINGGRGKIDDFQSWLSSWSLDPSKYQKLLPDQKVWLKGVMDKIDAKVQAKQQAISTANQALIDATDTKSHKQVIKNLNDSLEAIDRGGNAQSANPLQGVSTDELFKRLTNGK